jgi:hypothetical protein
MKIGIFKSGFVNGKLIKQFNGSDGMVYLPGDVVLIPEETYNAKDKLSSTIEICDIEDIMPVFDINNKNIKNVLLIRSGGFGDLLALSSITEYLKDYNIYFYTQKAKFGEAINWHTNQNTKVFEHTTPLFRDFKKYEAFARFRSWGYLNINGIVEVGACHKNWYEVFFEQMGVKFEAKYGKPSLTLPIIMDAENRLKSDKKSLLLCPRASSMIRTASLCDLVLATNYLGYQPFVHRIDLFDGDEIICEMNNVKILDYCSSHDMFVNLWFADMVLTVDSQPIHFREGIKKPCLAIYSSFTSDCRTKYYIHTKSVDIKSDCQMQPCFLHEWMNGEHIKYCQRGNGMNHAPCLSGINFVQQVKREITEYVR